MVQVGAYKGTVIFRGQDDSTGLPEVISLVLPPKVPDSIITRCGIIVDGIATAFSNDTKKNALLKGVARADVLTVQWMQGPDHSWLEFDDVGTFGFSLDWKFEQFHQVRSEELRLFFPEMDTNASPTGVNRVFLEMRPAGY